jgi:hypothetical protein
MSAATRDVLSQSRDNRVTLEYLAARGFEKVEVVADFSGG